MVTHNGASPLYTSLKAFPPSMICPFGSPRRGRQACNGFCLKITRAMDYSDTFTLDNMLITVHPISYAHSFVVLGLLWL